jgi:hypothetical protein
MRHPALFAPLTLLALVACEGGAPPEGDAASRNPANGPGGAGADEVTVDDCVAETDACFQAGGGEDECWGAFDACFADVDTSECDNAYETCIASGQVEDICSFDYSECLFSDYFGPCEVELGACFDAGLPVDECYAQYDVCYGYSWEEPVPTECDLALEECVASGQTEDICWFDYNECAWGDSFGPCEDELGACLDAGIPAEECYVQYDACYGYNYEWTPEDDCRSLFDYCVALGVSEGTCQQAFDECLTAIPERTAPAEPGSGDPCVDAHIACIESGRDPAECDAEFAACSGGPVAQ